MRSSRATRQVIHDLVSTPSGNIKYQLKRVQDDKDEIRKQLNHLQTELTHLGMEEQLLAQMLRLRQAEEDGIPGAGATLDGLAREAHAGRQESLSANVLSIVRQADRPLLPSDVQERLARGGTHAELNAVRVALRRWVERNQLIKQGRYYSVS